MVNHVGSPAMFEGKRFLPDTGMPIWKMLRSSTMFADCEPEPLTVATWMEKSLTALAGGGPCRCCRVVVRVRTVRRLRNDAVDAAQVGEVGRGDLQRFRGHVFLRRVPPHDAGTAFRRDDRVDRVLHHEYAVRHRDRQRAARAAFAG